MEWEFKYYYKRKGLAYFLVMERCKEYQVIRYYYKTTRRLFEFAQVWMNSQEKHVLAKDRHPFGCDRWKEDSNMTLKPWFKYELKYAYSYLGGVDRLGFSGVIVRSLLPELKKRGMCKSTHNVNPYRFVWELLHNNRLETLLKVRQYLLMGYFCYETLTDALWQSIRIALRHGYHWDNKEELKDWCDMIGIMNKIGADTHNPHYICPTDLKKAHDMWNKRYRRYLDVEQLKHELEKAAMYESTFFENRKAFLDLVFKSREIEVSVIQSAQDIVREGDAMHHCVGMYYNKPNSLIMSAKIDGKRIETIEVNLITYQLVQSRGLQNCSTKYHNRIVRLVKKHLDEIKERNIKAA